MVCMEKYVYVVGYSNCVCQMYVVGEKKVMLKCYIHAFSYFNPNIASIRIRSLGSF